MARPLPLMCSLLYLLALWRGCACASAEEYVPVQLTLQTAPTDVVAGQNATIVVDFKEPNGSHIPSSAFVVSHDRVLHLVAVGQDLDAFAHWHPTQSGPGANFTFSDVSFPAAGRYIIGFDGQLFDGPVANHTYVNATGQPAMDPATMCNMAWRTTINVTSVPLRLSYQPAVRLSSLMSPTTSAGGTSYHVMLSGPQHTACIPGVQQSYYWAFYNSSTGAPITDLNIYLGAPMHLAVANAELTFLAHEHGTVANGTSPEPASGTTNATTTSSAPNNTAMPGMDHGRRLKAPQPAAAARGPRHAATHCLAARRRLAATNGSDMADMPGMSSTTPAAFGPYIRTDVVLPANGTYLMVGQAARGNQLILAPFWVNCSGPRTGAPPAMETGSTAAPMKAGGGSSRFSIWALVWWSAVAWLLGL